MMTDFKKTKRSTAVRMPKRASYDRATVYAILDEAMYCHLGYVADGAPLVIPVNHWRMDDHLYFHGSTASRWVRALADGAEICVTVTLLDGLVMGRAAMHHSVNYRSVVVFGQARPVDDAEGKLGALRGLMEHLAPGRWDQVRPPSEKEMKATRVLALPLIEASAKVRAGPPIDDEPDYALPVWAGVLPLSQVAGRPEPDRRLDPAIGLPDYLRRG